MYFNVQKYEIELWKKAHARETLKLNKLSKSVKDDPVSKLLDINIEFQKLLASGIKRDSTEFMSKLKKLSSQDKIYREKRKKFDLIKEMDKESSQRILVNDIVNKINTLEYRMKRGIR